MCNTTNGPRRPSDRHKKVVQGILQRLFDEGQIYKDKQSGYYSVRQEQFLTDKERGPDGQFGPGVGRDRVSRRRKLLLQAKPAQRVAASVISTIEPDAVVPDFRQTELRNAVEKTRAATFASRARNRGSTGESSYRSTKTFVTYVWFDALTNYISFAGYDQRRL